MTERRQSVCTAYGRVSYPVFEEETVALHAEEMNAFYNALADAVVAYAAELNREREGGVRVLTAEYRSEITERRVTVEYTICLRRRGRVTARKRLTHTWEAGTLVPPRKHMPRPKKRKSKGGTGQNVLTPRTP